MIASCLNHIWQSTIFAVAAGLLTLAFRRDRARVRYWLWLSASLKFLVPFSLLLAAGARLERTPAARAIVSEFPARSFPMAQIGRPFRDAQLVPVPSKSIDWTALTLGVWALGFSCVALLRLRAWLRIGAAIRASAPDGTASGVEIRSLGSDSAQLLEPGVVGLLHPVLLLPADIRQRLTPAQIDAVIVHELCHVRSHDNLTAAVHMLVEALFWFHPLVWWIGARLVQERERACDEYVLAAGTDPAAYLDGILKICASYLQAPLPSVSGVVGADLKKRIRAIVTGVVPGSLSASKKISLVAAGALALSAPILFGMVGARGVMAQSRNVPAEVVQEPPQSTIQAPAATEPSQSTEYLRGLGNVSALTVTVKPRVDGQLLSINFKEGDLVQAGQLLATIDPRPFQLQLVQVEGRLAQDGAQLVELQYKKSTTPEDVFAALTTQAQAVIKSDEAGIEAAKLQLSYTQITAPITGIAGLSLVDPGNIVHAIDANGLLTITQLQPIAVLFTVPEDSTPQIAARFREGANLTVEAWDRTNSKRVAVGRLTGVDNQIDPQTGTVKLKATFDNKDGVLFPNQFVNVRLYLGKH